MTPEQLQEGARLLAAEDVATEAGVGIVKARIATDYWLRTHAGELIADAARLNKLDALTGDAPDHPWDVTICGPGNHGGECHTWLVTTSDGNSDFHESFGNSLRAAIDAARASGEPCS